MVALLRVFIAISTGWHLHLHTTCDSHEEPECAHKHIFRNISLLQCRDMLYLGACVCQTSKYPQHSEQVNTNKWKLTSGKLSNFVNSQRKQNSCMEMLDEMISRHMVNMIRLPSFFPGPNILYTKSSSIGDALIRRTTRRT
jgi:hypothetical protein